MMKLKKFNLSVFWATLYMCVWNFKQIQSFNELSMDYELTKETDGHIKWICTAKKKLMVCSIITDNCTKDEYTRILLHEVFHWLHYIFDYLWIDMSYDNTENFAYYLDYYYNEIVKFLGEIEKSENKKQKQKDKWK